MSFFGEMEVKRLEEIEVGRSEVFKRVSFSV